MKKSNKITAENFYERGILFNLQLGAYQGRKKLNKETLKKANLPSSIVRGVYDIFEEEFTKLLKAILSFDSETRAALKGACEYEKGKRLTAVDFPIRSVYYILGEDVETAINYIEERGRLRSGLIESAANKYEQAIEDFKLAYPKYYKAAVGSYPSMEEFIRRFKFDFQIFEMKAPSKELKFITPALYKRMTEKINSTVDTVKAEVVNIIRNELLTRAKTVLSQCKNGGKPSQRTLNGFQTIFNRIEEVYADFIDREDVFNVVAEIKSELTGVEAKDLRDDDKFRRKFGKTMAGIASTIEALPDGELIRAIEF